MGQEFKRTQTEKILGLLRQDMDLIHIIVGPRQTGKTTAAGQIEAEWEGRSLFVSADSPIPPGPDWIEFQWERARRLEAPKLLIIDEVQKIPGWSDSVKMCYDHDRKQSEPLRVLLLGSSSLQIQQGLTESLTGRFLLHRFLHWSFSECREAFGLDLDEWLYYGGYPGAVKLISEESIWKQYVRDSLIETVLTKDILQMHTVHKPILLRHLFLLAAGFPSRIVSWNKMLGQLTDAGNTTTLAHYTRLLSSAFLLSGLELYKIGGRQKRGSSPKLILWNNALINAVDSRSCKTAMDDPEWYGYLVENGVGAHLLNHYQDITAELFYWRHRDHEVDFVLRNSKGVWAIEVKSSRMKKPGGLKEFRRLHPEAKPVIIGGSGIPLEEFFEMEPHEIFS
jgi:uncharacterized protein